MEQNLLMLTNCLLSFLESNQFVSINKFCSILRNVDIGVPQESTFGPLLFLLNRVSKKSLYNKKKKELLQRETMR